MVDRARGILQDAIAGICRSEAFRSVAKKGKRRLTAAIMSEAMMLTTTQFALVD